ncbi:MAG: hypothetical protein GYA51_08570 [Candidatus Methanofastidiosa archaeon]|nr:hypothetical protein [Candidatus Methanofastidiosa archaeon]
MKEKIKIFLKVHLKPIAGVVALIVVATGIMVAYNSVVKEKHKKAVEDMRVKEVVIDGKSAVTKTPTSEEKYVPISEGWKISKSAKGNITSAQKANIDSLIEIWKGGNLTDIELKEKIINYLKEQKIDYNEISVTSKGYTLYDEVPEIDLRDGGNLYSFVGTYSTGKQNPDGTNKTVCYNWSAFVF